MPIRRPQPPGQRRIAAGRKRPALQRPAPGPKRTNPIATALLGPQAPVPVGQPDRFQPAPAPSPAGPYAGAAGTEAQNPGQQRQPLPDWANPASPNYERRNYYIQADGVIVPREPGYYNPDNPFDTGRPNETQGEYRGSWDPSMERRMDEPGITPWGPGGKASPAGAFPGTPGAASQPQVFSKGNERLLESLMGGGEQSMSGRVPPPAGEQSIDDNLLAYILSLIGPRNQAGRTPGL